MSPPEEATTTKRGLLHKRNPYHKVQKMLGGKKRFDTTSSGSSTPSASGASTPIAASPAAWPQANQPVPEQPLDVSFVAPSSSPSFNLDLRSSDATTAKIILEILGSRSRVAELVNQSCTAPLLEQVEATEHVEESEEDAEQQQVQESELEPEAEQADAEAAAGHETAEAKAETEPAEEADMGPAEEAEQTGAQVEPEPAEAEPAEVELAQAETVDMEQQVEAPAETCGADFVVTELVKQGSSFPWNWKRRTFHYSEASRTMYYYDTSLPTVSPCQLPEVALGQITLRAVVHDQPSSGPHSLVFVGECGRLLHARADSAATQESWLEVGNRLAR